MLAVGEERGGEEEMKATGDAESFLGGEIESPSPRENASEICAAGAVRGENGVARGVTRRGVNERRAGGVPEKEEPRGCEDEGGGRGSRGMGWMRKGRIADSAREGAKLISYCME